MMKLYALGSNGSGQLGLGHRNDIWKPEPCLFDQKDYEKSQDIHPVTIAGSGNATYILTRTGGVYCAGSVMPGIIAKQPASARHPEVSSTLRKFKHVELSEGVSVKLLAATWEAIVLVTDRDEVLVSGKGFKGELGLGPDMLATDRLRRVELQIPSNVTISDIASGMGHVALVLSDGQVLGWGNGRKGQLGSPATIVWTPRHLSPVPFAARRLACGREFTCLMGESGTAQLIVLGSNNWGVLNGMPQDIVHCTKVHASWNSIFLQNGAEMARRWGRHDRGQLGPQQWPLLRDFAAGSEHIIALSEHGLVACGWGEHGNCGQAIDEHFNAKELSSEIDLDSVGINASQIQGVAAGCATTFFWTD